MGTIFRLPLGFDEHLDGLSSVGDKLEAQSGLCQALRKALLQFYHSLTQGKLVDYKVCIFEESVGIESQVRVLIESSDGVDERQTVGSSTDIIEASWLALADGLEYWLLKQRAQQEKKR